MAIQVLNQNEVDEVSGGNAVVVAIVAGAVVATVAIANGCSISAAGGGWGYHVQVVCK